MRNIQNYKTRFYTLMESTMGDVKPFIFESSEYEKFITPTKDMVKDFDVFSNGVDIRARLSLNGNEYKLTLPGDVYDKSERIEAYFFIDKQLMILDDKNIKSNDLVFDFDDVIEKRNNYVINLSIILPSTQEEFDENSPYVAYIDVPCENVKDKKIKFSVEVPSGSKIFELY